MTARKPGRVRLAVLILEGYVYLALIVLSFVGIVALVVWGLAERRPAVGLLALVVGVPLLMTTAAAIRALFFRQAEPSGVPITREQTPALFAMIDDLRGALQSPPLERVLITDAFNASAFQLARAGVLWTRHILVIGYPLFATLPPAHLRAVVAHELGHLSRSHGRMSAWIYRTTHSWWRLISALNQRGVLPIHVRLLSRWYLPRLNRHAMAICRAQEFLADQLASTAAGKAVCAETLVAIDAAAQLESAYWDAVFARIAERPELPRPFAELGPGVWQLVQTDDPLLPALLDRETNPYDSHPALRERLQALGEPARLPVAETLTAAEVLLGAQMSRITAELDDDWQNEHHDEWRRRHEDIRSKRTRLQELMALPSPSPADIFERGRLLETLENPGAALPIYREAYARGHARAGLAVGRLLLDDDDPAAMPIIESAMAADPSLILEGSELLVPYLDRHNRIADRHRISLMARRHQARHVQPG